MYFSAASTIQVNCPSDFFVSNFFRYAIFQITYAMLEPPYIHLHNGNDLQLDNILNTAEFCLFT